VLWAFSTVGFFLLNPALAAKTCRLVAIARRHLWLVPDEVVLLGKAGCWFGYGRAPARPTKGAADATAAAF
jgi:hypothetical protein